MFNRGIFFGTSCAWRAPVIVKNTGFITEWTVAGDATARTITLPLVNTRAEGTLAYDFTVDWGDGSTSTVAAYNSANRIHTYAANGTYQVEIRGTMNGWSFNGAGDRLKIKKVVDWGTRGGYFYGFNYLKGGFKGCTGLTSVASGGIVPIGSGILTDGFWSIFDGCSTLASIPEDLFKYNTNVTTNGFRLAFNGCSAITAIPAYLFKYNTAVSTIGFLSVFNSCTSLTAIPADLFRYNTALTTIAFQSAFSNCTSLTAIPADLFRYNTAVSTSGFNTTFSSCTKIAAIPADLFKYNTAVSTSGFNTTFYNCQKLETVPADLFRYNVSLTTSAFVSVFASCSALKTLPDDLFRYNTLLTSDVFNSAFSSSGLTTLPVDMFKYNTILSGTAFQTVFFNCTSLETIPDNLFKYNTSVTSFYYALYECKKLKLNAWTFYTAGEESTRFLNRAITFQNCFSRTSFSGTQGTAPALWDCSYGTLSPTTAACYGGAGNNGTSIANYASVPAGYK